MATKPSKSGEKNGSKAAPIFRKPSWEPSAPPPDARIARLNWHKPLIAKLQAARIFKAAEKEEVRKVEMPDPPPLPPQAAVHPLPFWIKEPSAKIQIALRAFRNAGASFLEVVCHQAFLMQPPSTAMVCSIALHSSLMETQTHVLSNSASGEVVELGTLTYSQTCSFEIPEAQDPMELLSTTRQGAMKQAKEVELFDQIKSKKLQLSIRLYEKPDKSTLCKRIIAQRRLPLVSILGVKDLEKETWLELYFPAVGRKRLRDVFSDAVSNVEAFERRAAGRIRVAKRGGGPTLDCAEFERIMNDYGIVFERERRVADHSHSPHWHHHGSHSTYIGPYPHNFQSTQQAASIFRAVIRASDHPELEEMSWPEFVKAVKLSARRLGVRIRQYGSPSAAAERRLALLQPLAVEPMDEYDNNRTVTLQSDVLSSLLALEPDHLEMLKSDFERKGGELELDDFVELFRQRFGSKANIDDLMKLFVQIDANAGGSVAWSEFASSVLQSALSIGRLEIPHQVDKSDPILEGVHTTLIPDGLHFTSERNSGLVAATFVDSRDMLFCINSFGILRAFHARSGALANVYDMHQGPDTAAGPLSRKRGVNDAPPYRVLTAASFKGAGSTMIAVSSTDRIVRFYDPMVHEVVGKTKVLGDAMVTTLYAFQLPIWQAADCHEWLVFGDSAGYVHLYNAHSAVREIEKEGYVTPNSLIHRLRLFEPPIVRATKDMIHIDRTEITATRFVEDLGCLAIASFGGAIAIYDLTNKEVRDVYNIHKMAVNVMEYVTPYKYLASAGQERHIVVFDPYTGRRIGVMRGHHAAVVALAFQLSTERLISMDSLSTLKWWNANTNEPIRTISCIEDGMMTKHHHVGAFLLYRAKGTEKDYLALFAKDLRVWRLREGRARISTKFVYQDHIASIVSVQFSHPLGQIVSVDTTGLTAVWNMRSGQQVGWFQADASDYNRSFAKEGTKANSTVTAAVLDNTQRRLCVGWDQGAMQMYNFSSGTLLNELISDAYSEITDITLVTPDGDRSEWSEDAENITKDMYIIAAEDNGKLWVWPSKPRGDEKAIHNIRRLYDISYPTDDIQCIAASSPHVLATGAHAGGIHVWNIASGRIRQTIEPPDAFLTRTGHFTVDAVQFLQHPCEHVMLSTGSDGVVFFHNATNGSELASLEVGPAEYYKHTDITCMRIDATNTFMFIGDSKGFLKTFEISRVVAKAVSTGAKADAEAFTVKRWEAFLEGVSSLICVAPNSGVQGSSAILLVAGSTIGKVGVWSADGKPLGILRPGEKPCWNVSDVEQTCESSAQLFKPAMQEWIASELGRMVEGDREQVLCLSIIQGNEINVGPESLSVVRVIMDGKEVAVTGSDVGSSPHWEWVEKIRLAPHAHVLTLKVCETIFDDTFGRVGSSVTRYSESKPVGSLVLPINTMTLHSERDDWFELEGKKGKEKAVKRLNSGPLGQVHLKVKLTTREELDKLEELEYHKKLDQASLTVARWWMHSKSKARHAMTNRHLQAKAEETLFLKNSDGSPCQYGSRQVLERLHCHAGKWWPPPDESSRLGYYYKTKERRILEASRRSTSSPSSPPHSHPPSRLDRQRSPTHGARSSASTPHPPPKLPLHGLIPHPNPSSHSLDPRPLSARPASSQPLPPYPSARRPATARAAGPQTPQAPTSPALRPTPSSPVRSVVDGSTTPRRVSVHPTPPKPPPMDPKPAAAPVLPLRSPRLAAHRHDGWHAGGSGRGAPSFTYPRVSVVGRSTRGLEIANVAAASTVKAHPRRTTSPSKGTYDDFVPNPDPPPGSVLALNRELKKKEDAGEERELEPDEVRRRMRKEWIFQKIIPNPDRAKRLSGMKTYQTQPDPAEEKPLVPIKKLKDQVLSSHPMDSAVSGEEATAGMRPDSAKKLEVGGRSSVTGRPLSGTRTKRPTTASSRGDPSSQTRLISSPLPPSRSSYSTRPNSASAAKKTPRGKAAVHREVGGVHEESKVMDAERALRSEVRHLVMSTHQQAQGRKTAAPGAAEPALLDPSAARSELLAKGSRSVYVSNPQIRSDPVPVVKLLTAILHKAAGGSQPPTEDLFDGAGSRPPSGSRTRSSDGVRPADLVFGSSSADTNKTAATEAALVPARGSKLSAGAAALGNSLNAIQAGVTRASVSKSLAPPPSLASSLQSLQKRRSFIFKTSNPDAVKDLDKDASRPHSRLEGPSSPLPRKVSTSDPA